ncbi:hypothetical protein EJF36_17435 [Bacillus sp. HMF5848]|uniref:hypothetical protein n=1 Tax=Bacillus sp. HMF5848 TaxID=2495421 RepID=UPI000F7A74D1|nr:hypothetical protein [Bacillus sp. HMF5848]RSK28507.1 hypothetical protein EJF36_17435 [Bacillus sp. HMF5848]
MANKKLLYFCCLFIFSLLFGCSSEVSQKYSKLEQIEKVIVQSMKSDGTLNKGETVQDKQTIENVKNIFSEIEWKTDKNFKIDRKEDAMLTLFYNSEEATQEGTDEFKINEYRIWFNEDLTATIITYDENESYFSVIESHSAQNLANLIY